VSHCRSQEKERLQFKIDIIAVISFGSNGQKDGIIIFTFYCRTGSNGRQGCVLSSEEQRERQLASYSLAYGDEIHPYNLIYVSN